jgi:predicted chitinase
MLEEKAIPSRNIQPGANIINGRGGSSILQDINGNILLTTNNESEGEIFSPEKAYSAISITSDNEPTDFKPNIVLPSSNFSTINYSQQDTSTITPVFIQSNTTKKVELINVTESISRIPLTSSKAKQIETDTLIVDFLPDIEPQFSLLVNETGSVSLEDYVGLTNVYNEILVSRSSNGTYPVVSLKYSELNTTQKTNFNVLVNVLKQYDFSPIEIKAILAVCSKESGYTTKKEVSYKNTSSDRIKSIFKSAFKNKTLAEIDVIKKDDKQFWDYVYGYLGPFGKQYGHTKAGDGEKYLGRGFNGITFKTVYQKTQDIYNTLGAKGGKIDIVSNPYLLETNTSTSAHMTAAYFINAKNTYFPKKVFTDLNTAILFFIRANAGWGISTSNNILQEGLTKAKGFASTLPDII